MSGVAERIGRLQNPEYTGANRCMPCTMVNSLIAVVLATTVGVLAWWVATPTVAAAGAVVTLAVGAASIYFRGYLIPGTPTLTKRYFPEWFLAYFDKHGAPGPRNPGNDSDKPWAHTYHKMPATQQEPKNPKRSDADPEVFLLEAGALTECEDVDDLCLAEEFEEKWNERIEAVADEDASRDRLLDLLELDEADVEYDEYDSGFRVLANGQFAGRWESRAAFRADVAAGELLEDRIHEWEELEMNDRGAVLNGLRLFITTCPECGSDVEMETERVESCCREHTVAALTCDECDARLFESNAL